MQVHSFACDCPFVPEAFVTKTALLSLSGLGTLAESQFTTNERAYLSMS